MSFTRATKCLTVIFAVCHNLIMEAQPLAKEELTQLEMLSWSVLTIRILCTLSKAARSGLAS